MSSCRVVGIAIAALVLAGCGSSPPDPTPKAQREARLCLGVSATIVGSAKDDVITGTEQADVIWTGPATITSRPSAATILCAWARRPTTCNLPAKVAETSGS
jgi:hypothetical protein